MTELPEELTPELLGLVLDEEVQFGLLGGKIKNNNLSLQLKDTKEVNVYKQLNIDTLTRLMKEWCLKEQNNCVASISSTLGILDSTAMCNIYSSKYALGKETKAFYGDTEFEAVLKTTAWVAKEKKLI